MLEWIQNAAADNASCHGALDAMGMSMIFSFGKMPPRMAAVQRVITLELLCSKVVRVFRRLHQMILQRWIGAYTQQPNAINLAVSANPSSWTATVPPGRVGMKSSYNTPLLPLPPSSC